MCVREGRLSGLLFGLQSHKRMKTSIVTWRAELSYIHASFFSDVVEGESGCIGHFAN